MKVSKKARNFVSGDKFFQTMIGILVILIGIIVLYPLIYVISASFSNADAVKAGKVILLPVEFTLKGYKYVFANKEIWMAYANTIFYTVMGTVVALSVTLPCAYALSRKDLLGKNVFMIYFMITMYISGGMIPDYLNMKSLGLVNTRTYMVIGGALSVYNMIVCRSFFMNSIPYEITEAARIDGCNDFRIFAKIIMPLSKPIVAVMSLYYGIGKWNDYFGAMIYLDDRSKYPLQLVLREILLQGQFLQQSLTKNGGLSVENARLLEEIQQSTDLAKYCVIVVAAVPIMIIYPWLQKFFVKGVMIGSVKG